MHLAELMAASPTLTAGVAALITMCGLLGLALAKSGDR